MADQINTVGNSLGKVILGAAIVCLVVPPLLAGQDAGGAVETYFDGQNIEVHYTATFSEDALIFGELRGYDTLRLDDGERLNQPGRPLLPAKDLRIALPAGMEVSGARVVDTQSAQIPGEYYVFPAQPPRRVSDVDPLEFVPPDPQTYGSSDTYPAKLVEFVHQTDLAGQAIALVRLYPVQYVPVQRQLTLHTSITFVLEGVNGYECGDYLPSCSSESARADYERMVMEAVVNPEDVELRTPENPPPHTTGVGPGYYEYVIIAKSGWMDDFQPLADWKTRKGVPATVVDRDWIYGEYSNSSNPAKLRAFVQDARANWGTVYFLLGGDTDTIPYHTKNINGDNIPNDTFYADFDADWMCEVHVGRASVRDTAAIATFVNKVLTYETNPPPTNYAKCAAFFGFDLYAYGSHEGENCKENIRDRYLPADWSYRREYDSEGGGHEQDVKGYLNLGNNLVNHIDHCGTDVLGIGNINHGGVLTTSEVKNLTNVSRQSIFYTIGCWPCNYPDSECVGEGFVRNTGGGGVAFIGNSRYGYYSPYHADYYSLRFDRYFFRSLFNQNHYRLGSCFSDHKNDSCTSDSTYRYIFTELTLLGDPELPIWTENPITMAAVHDATLPLGAYIFIVHVVDSYGNVPDAIVCLWKEGDVYEIGYTNIYGDAYFTQLPATPGTMYVTVTKRNYKPYLGSAEVIEQEYTLTVNVVGNGSVIKDPDQATYSHGQIVELTAVPEQGWLFDSWSGDLNGSENPKQITMISDMDVTAHFVEDTTDCPEDLNGDGQVGLEDLTILLTNYGQSGMGPEDGDLDGNGVVDLADLSQLLGYYGQDCPTH